MSVTFSVSGVLLRTFLNTIQCASKLGDGVFFVAHKTYLEISALNTTSSSHLLAVLPADSLGGYRFTAPANDTSEDDKQVFFYLLTRSLQVTVLHQAVGSLVSITVSFAETPQEGDQLTDSVKWDCACIGGVRKTFHLRTATAVPTRVCTDGVEYPFKVCGRPETFGYLLGSLPTSAGECIIFPLSSQFELRCGHVSAERNDQLDQPPNGVSTAVVTANASSFDSFECAIDEGAVQSGVLPGKMLELKPVKVACMLCKLLSLPMELSSGYEHSPVVIRSVAYQSSDGERLRGVGAPDAHAPISFVMHIAGLDVAHSDGTGDAARRDTAVAAPGPSTLSARSSERRASVQLAVESTAASAVVGATPSDDTAVAGTPSFSPNGTTRSPNNSVTEGGSKALGPHNDAIPSHLQSSQVSGLAAQTPLRGMSAHVQSQATHVDASYISGTPNDSDAANEERSAPRQSHISFARKAVVPSGVDSRSESHRSTGGSMVADSQVNSGRQSMTALYPLDFEAFTKASVEDEKEEIDEELQRFLDSCTAMLVGEAEQHDNDAR